MNVTTVRRGRPDRAAPRSHFLRHLLEMTFAMVVGMMASAAIFLTAAGMTVDDALRTHAALFVLTQAAGMTTAMVVWMRNRGHGWRACAEMGAAMVVPAIPLACLSLLDVIGGRVCSVYCLLTIAAMVLLMLYRRSEYGGPALASGTE